MLVGLDRAPEHLLSSRHPVENVIGLLNEHSDLTVAQYSFWAAVEHPGLGLDHMRVLPKDYLFLPPNVQGWAIRLLAKDNSVARKHYELIVAASESVHLEVRDGLALGIRDVYYDSLDVCVIDWYIEEPEQGVREKLLEHMSLNASKSTGYYRHVEEAFRSSAPGSPLRARLQAACGDDKLALAFRRIELQTGDPDLFAEISGGHVTNNNQTFNGQNFAGISNTGTGNTGEVKMFAMTDAQKQIVPVLERLRAEIEAQSDKLRSDEGASIVEAAINEPTKGKVARVVEWLETLVKGGDALAGLARSTDTIVSEIHHLLPNLPHTF